MLFLEVLVDRTTREAAQASSEFTFSYWQSQRALVPILREAHVYTMKSDSFILSIRRNGVTTNRHDQLFRPRIVQHVCGEAL